MDIQSVDQLAGYIASYGFPIAAFWLVWQYLTRQFDKIVAELSGVIKANTDALTAGTAVIQHCKDLNREE